jgi:hypothetical protein
MAAYVVYDIYWDPVEAYATDAEAQTACQADGSHPGCHVVFKEDAEPGNVAAMPYVPKPWDD